MFVAIVLAHNRRRFVNKAVRVIFPRLELSLQLNKELVDDFLIVKGLKEGDINAYERLFNSYYHPLCLFASRMINDKECARDLVQDLFVTIYTQRQSLNIHTSLKSYLFRALSNLSLNELRQRESHSLHHDEIKKLNMESPIEDEIAYAELQFRLAAAMETLPRQCGKIFEMSRFGGKTNSEIANDLGISIRTVETQISRALSILRSQLVDFLPVAVLITFL